MKRCLFFLIWVSSTLTMHTQELQHLKLNCEEIETLFLKNNLELIAERYNIDIADAVIKQAKLWDNPTLSVSDINLWSTKSQQDQIKEIATSSFAPNTEFSVELSQLIQTANKRGKLVRRENVSKEIAMQEFGNVMRGLKTELRKSIYELQYIQSYLDILLNQHQSMNQLVEAYKKQMQQGNIAKSELLRLQSSLLELKNEINNTQFELTQQEKTLKILLNVGPSVQIEIADDSEKTKAPEQLTLSKLWQIADDSRPDMQQYKLQTQYNQRSLDYEKAQRIPDVTLSANYDRYSGIWKDFVGVGVSVNLPFFNRNQGNIRAAKLNIGQSLDMEQQQQNIIRHEVVAAYDTYTHTYSFYKRINEDSLLPELDSMLDVYARNLLNRNISMLEYVDFMEAYRTNKQILLSARKNVEVQFEELEYTVGTEIK